MTLSDFDFSLPGDRIALRPASPRDTARMLVVTPGAEPPLADAAVGDLDRWLRPGDVLVVNNTKVLAAALTGTRTRGAASARISLNLLERTDDRSWWALARPLKRLAEGDRIEFGGEAGLTATVMTRSADGRVLLGFDRGGADFEQALAVTGAMPLPPYIAGKRATDDCDRTDYQTMFAAESGAVAAPTAGLHFTPELLARLEALQVRVRQVTLHVGAGTFLPVKTERIEQHRMHAEYGELSPPVAAELAEARAAGQRIVAVGTTSMRLLESAVDAGGTIRPFAGETDIFIRPGYRFAAVDVLLTNFHLPKSTLFMLVCAFSGTATMKRAYAHAIERGYRFFSYGDACLLFPGGADA